MRLWKLAVVASVLAMASAAQAQNTMARLTDGDATFDAGNASLAGALPTTGTNGGISLTSNFRIKSNLTGTDNQFTDWWWYRVDIGGGASDTRERNLFNATTKVLTGTNQVDWGFAMNNAAGIVPGLTASLTYILSDTGAESANIYSGLQVFNGSGLTITINLQHYIDPFLGGQDAGDAIDPLDLSGGDRAWHLRDTSSTGTTPTWYGQYRGFGAQGAGAGAFSVVGSQVGDTTVDDFIPDVGAGGVVAQDNSMLMQYRITLLPGESTTARTAFCVADNILAGDNVPGATFCTPTVPEPSTLGLVGLAALAMIRRRR